MTDDRAMKFRRRPVEVYAKQFDGNGNDPDYACYWHFDAITTFMIMDECLSSAYLKIPASIGPMNAYIGYWILYDREDGFYCCKPDIFEQTYERVVDPDHEPHDQVHG